MNEGTRTEIHSLHGDMLVFQVARSWHNNIMVQYINTMCGTNNKTSIV